MNDMGKFWSAAFLSDDLNAWMAANGPVETLRQCTRDLRVLTRHQTRLQVHEYAPHIARPDNCWACDKPSPCLELADLAEAYGLGVEAEGNQP